MPNTRRQKVAEAEVVPAMSPDSSVSLSYVIEDATTDNMIQHVVATESYETLEKKLAILTFQIKQVKKMMRALGEEGVLKEAKRLYYHEYKTHPELIAHVRTSVGDGNLPTTKAGKIMIPYQLLKKRTDEVFMTADETTRNSFIEKAKENLAKKAGKMG